MTSIKQYIKKIPVSLRIMGFCILSVLKNPTSVIMYTGNPIAMPPQTPVPWLISLCVIMLGVASWCGGEHWQIEGLSEAARAMVYIPLSYMFGKSTGLADAARAKKKSED